MKDEIRNLFHEMESCFNKAKELFRQEELEEILNEDPLKEKSAVIDPPKEKPRMVDFPITDPPEKEPKKEG